MFFSPVDLFLPVSGCRLFLLKHTGVCNPVFVVAIPSEILNPLNNIKSQTVSSNSLMTGFVGLV